MFELKTNPLGRTLVVQDSSKNNGLLKSHFLAHYSICQMIFFVVLTVCITVSLVSAFPESGDPITEEPPLIRPSTTTFIATIFENAPCSSWDLVLNSTYSPPPTGPWSKVILDFSASENGTQYDRYGAFWFGGVELLRTTTAEPTAEGIVWRVEKDVTAYLNLFLSPNTAYLSIPNNVDSTYTGIPLVNITLTFYAASDEFPAPTDAATVLPLSNSPGNWNVLGVTAGSNLTYTTTIPHDDVVGVSLELMASPHGCEEFWYTNIDDDEAASKYGLCGGGVYRELQVFVDGRLAGAIYPFPVIYTGGINPFLWRPLTGIMSFDIPAYSFDLSPFVLGDGRAHEITLKVLGGDSQGGVWYLDATLMLFRDASAAPVSGGLVYHADSGTNSSSNSSASTDGYGWDTAGTHTYLARGQIIKASSSSAPVTVTAEVSGALKAWNTNAISDRASVQTTAGALTSEHSNSLSALLVKSKLSSGSSGYHAVRSHAHYPYSIVSSYKQDATTFDMSANVNISYQRANTYPQEEEEEEEEDSAAYTVAWSNTLLSNAAYNRTLDHTVVYVESDAAAGGYHVSSSGKGCYQRISQASDGFVLSDESRGQCDLPGGKYMCGYELCTGPAGSAAAGHAGRKPVEQEPLRLPAASATVSRAVKTDREPLVRHPLMGRARLQLGA